MRTSATPVVTAAVDGASLPPPDRPHRDMDRARDPPVGRGGPGHDHAGRRTTASDLRDALATTSGRSGHKLTMAPRRSARPPNQMSETIGLTKATRLMVPSSPHPVRTR